jgi:5-methylcytosine-specific restriction endonuclease McrA
MPCDYTLYPPNWNDIRARILDQANHRCDRCAVPNHQLHPITGSRVVLTIAHLDHDITHNEDTNLAALCQRCHLAHDAHEHAMHTAATRRRNRERTGQLTLEMRA